MTIAGTIAIALALLPFISILPIDRDRLAPLALLPALFIGRKWRSSGEVPSRPQAIDGAFLLFAAILASIASLTSAHLATSLVSLSGWSWIVAGMLLARQLATDRIAIRCVLLGIVTGSTLGCLALWARWTEGTLIAGFPYYSHGRLFGLHMMAGTMAGLAVLIDVQKRRFERLVIGLATAISCGGLLWAGGRAPMLGVAAALVVWFWFSRPNERRSLSRNVPWVLGGGVAISLIQWSPEPYLGWWGAAARSAAATTVNELSSTRLDFWSATWLEILEKPWFGHGADSYRFITPKLDGDQPHNWILQFLLDFGVIGGGLLAVLLVLQAWRGLRSNTPDTDISGLQRGAAAGFVACLITGLLDGVFYHSITLIPAAFLAGIAGASTAGAPLRPNLSTLGSKLWIPSSRIATKVHLLTLALVGSGILLLFHGYLHLSLARSTVPPSPDVFEARMLRAFPSTTAGLHRWLDGWRVDYETTTLEWAHWAQSNSDQAARYHVYAAIMYADRDDFAAADREMTVALAKAHWTQKPRLEEFRESIRAAAHKAAP